MITMFNQIVILLLYIISLAGCTMAPTHLLVTRAGPCYDTMNTPITVSELSVTTHIYDSLLRGEFNVSEDIKNGWKIKATMQKCVDIRNIETCDFYRSFYLVKEGCRDERENEQETFDKLLFYYTQPKLECPIKAGRYMLIDYPLFAQDNYLVVPEAKISTSVFGYTLRLDGFIQNERDRQKIFCVEALLQLMYTRRHNWVERTRIKDIKETTVSTTVAVSREDEE